MPPNPSTAAPANVPVLILMPGARSAWKRAILSEHKGRLGLRWRIFDDGGRSWVCGREFRPLEWMSILPERGGVQ
jgi:hypothetical protein